MLQHKIVRVELINNKGKGNRTEWEGVGETELLSWKMEVEIMGLNFMNSKLSDAGLLGLNFMNSKLSDTGLSNNVYFKYNKPYL